MSLTLHWIRATTISFFAELPDSAIPLMKKYKKAFDLYAAKDERRSPYFYAGFGLAEPMVEALKRCGRDLTRDRLARLKNN